MQAKYKHKPTGHIYQKAITGSYFSTEHHEKVPAIIVENGSDWELITEKKTEWTILSLISSANKLVHNVINNVTFCAGSNTNLELSSWQGGNDPINLITNHSDRFSIYSVRRESDGEIFTIGDTIKDSLCGDSQIINFDLSNSLVIFTVFGGIVLTNAQKAKLKEWEITAFRGKISGTIYTKIAGYDSYSSSNGGTTGPTSVMLLNPNNEIYSIKRLSDGLEFSINDMISSKCWDKPNIERNSIESIYISTNIKDRDTLWEKGSLILKTKNSWQTTIEDAIKIRKVFTTEDGVDIFDVNTDKFFFVTVRDNYNSDRTNPLWTVCKRDLSTIFRYEPEFDKYFSTEELAKKWIKDYKPKSVIYVTVDKVPLYGGETVWFACKKYESHHGRVRKKVVWKVNLFDKNIMRVITRRNGYIRQVVPKNDGLTSFEVFSTKEAADAYVAPIFITADGVEIEDQKQLHLLWGISVISDKGHAKKQGAKLGFYTEGPMRPKDNRKWFFDEAKADEYLLYNCKLLSINDVATIYITANSKTAIDKPSSQPSKLKRLVERLLKEKLDDV